MEGGTKARTPYTPEHFDEAIDPDGEPRGVYAVLLLRPEGLKEIKQFADAIGVEKTLIIPREKDGAMAAPTSLVADAHAAGLKVHAWTFRAENAFLPAGMRSSDDAAASGDFQAELAAYLETGLDGFFTDHPILGVQVRDTTSR